ncbi:MAG: branched-chain amino acid ABC-type transport system, permease component [Actinomycetia bacterium]|nr:branched-chain amino acid ABC-type transport system, permease component [Actinomycetes bacterium]
MSQRWSNLLVWAGTIAFIVLVSKAAWAGNPVNGTSLTNLVVLALPVAGIIAMSATGLVVVYTTTGVFNFAQGAIGMFLAYVDWELTVAHGLPQAVALPLVVLVIAPLLGIGLDRAIMRHLQGKQLVVQLMVTVGLLFAFVGLANMIWNQNNAHSMPQLFAGKGFHIGDVLLTWHRFITIMVAVALAIGLRILLVRTRIGIAMRAVVDNRDLAALEGARSSVLSSFAWALGCSVAALAGILIAPETADMSTTTLTFLILTAFAAAVVGRLRSLPLTYLGAIILALATQWMASFLRFSDRWTNVPDALPTIMLFIVLLLLPRAEVQFARIGQIRRVERVSSVRDTAIGLAAFVAFMAILTLFLSSSDPTNTNRLALGMCTALLALSLVPLTGWAGQVSLAPLAFAGIGAVAYTRLGGAHGSVWAVFLAALVTIPVGALFAFPAMRLQGLYLALATLAFAAMVEEVFYTQPFAVGPGERPVARLHLLGIDFSSPKSFLILVTVVFGLCGVGVVALRRSPFGRRLVALRDSEAASVTVGVNILETKLAVFALSAGIAGFAGAFYAMSFGTLNNAQGFQMIAGLPVVLALVIGGVGFVAGALFAGVFGFVTLFVQDNWHISLWIALFYLAPGLAVLGIIQNPSGAVVPIGEGFARLLPWRKDAKQEYEEMTAAAAEPEVGELGLERPFAESDVLLVDRELGISNDVPRPVAAARSS